VISKIHYKEYGFVIIVMLTVELRTNDVAIAKNGELERGKQTVGHSKKAKTKNVKSAPKVTSPAVAGHKRKEAPPATIAIASKNATTSPLTGLNSLVDDQTTEGDSLQTSITEAQRREENDEVIEILDQEDSRMKGDGGDSDAEGDGYEIAQSFVDGMVDVERERFNADGFQIEREVECDTNTAVEGGTVISNTDSRQRLWGAPPGWHPPEPPPNWKSKDIKVDKGEPSFAEVDNPGQWSQYTYQPVFQKTMGSISIMLCHPVQQLYQLIQILVSIKLVDMNSSTRGGHIPNQQS
jgi:hypothetical protein